MPQRAQPFQGNLRWRGNEQSGSAEARRKLSLAMVRKPGLVLSDRLFKHRRALGSRGHVKGGTWSVCCSFLVGGKGVAAGSASV
jgi:hypothetical protein